MTSAQVQDSPQPTQEGRADQSSAPNKYKYKDFDGPAGERLLKSILRKILPLALFETWQVLAAENQAPGNDAFLGITKLAEYRQRTDRKIRMDLDDLEGRQLLAVRHEWKIFRQADGSTKAKPVAIKDFERLYDLAYEYLVWPDSDSYVPPDRDYMDLIRENEPLMRKLMRFDNYRRLLCNRKPGKATQEKEIHQWYKNYDGATGPQSGQHQEVVRDAQEVAEDTTESIRKEYLKESLKEDLKKASIERIETSDNKNQQSGDSFDSGICSEERVGGHDYTKPTIPNEVITHEEETEEVSTIPTTQTNITKLPGFVSGKSRAEQADLDPRVQAFVELAMTAPQTSQGKSVPNKKPAKATPNPLIDRFVREMSRVLRDENLEGSVTRSLRAVEHRGLSQMDILACLITAYVVARDTKNIHEKYRRPNGDLRMPLFCTMFERFACQCAQGNFDYNEDHLAQHITDDQDLTDFIEKRRPEEMVLQESSATSNAPRHKPVVAVTPRSAGQTATWMSQGEAEALAREILLEGEPLGVTNAVVKQQGNVSVVVLTCQGRSMPMLTPEHWQKVRHILEGEKNATL